jgi:adenylate kinase family enzyme
MGKKIIIIGNGGTGKSTLGTKLSKIMGIEVHHLDLLTFTEDGGHIGEAVFHTRLKEILSRDSWIVEGWSYQSTLSERFTAADTIIYLDYPIWVSYWGALKRNIYSTFRRDRYTPVRSLWKKSGLIARAMWKVHKIYEPQARILLSTIENKYYYHFKNRRQLRNKMQKWKVDMGSSS